MRTVKDILESWPDWKALADDLGCGYGTPRSWARLGSIPGKWWKRLVVCAEARGYALTLEELAEVHAARVSDEEAA